MAEQPLDGMEIGARFQEMGCKRVAEAMNAAGFANPGPPFGSMKDAMGCHGREGPGARVIGEEPEPRPIGPPIGAEVRQ